jgi:hypothetical protein
MAVKYGQKADRNYEISQRRKNGETYTQIGRSYGISPSRVMHICTMQQMAEKYSEEPDENMRFVVVMRNGIKSICVKQILRTYRDHKMVLWKTPGSTHSSRHVYDEDFVLAELTTEREANEIIDNILEALMEEDERHQKKRNEILYKYSRRS